MRRMRSRMSSVAVVAMAGVCSVASPALAQDEGVMVDARFVGLSNMPPHAKDAAAYKALMMLGERLAEIPGEVGGPEEAQAGVELLWDFFRGMHSLRIDRTAEGPGVAMALTVTPELPMNAQSYLDKFADFAEASGGPIEEDGEGYVLSTPMGDATLRTGEVMGRSSVVMLVGATEPATIGPLTYDLPRSLPPVFSAEVNLRMLGEMLAQAIAADEPEFAEFIDENRWAIDEAPMMRLAIGNDQDRSHLVARMVGSRGWLTKLGMDPSIAFTADDLGDIPQDATVMTVFPFDLGVVVNFIDWAAEQEGEDPFGDFEAEFGFDLRGDVLENLGPRFAYYQSLSTGGGGLLSAVLVAELKDAERLAETHAELVGRFNELSARETKGYVRIRDWKAGAHDAFSVATPGLPVPFEPSWAIVDGKLVVSLSPGGLVAAVEQMAPGGTSIADNELFREAVTPRIPEGGAAQITFSDTAHFARVGYGTASLLMSGLSNAVRSPSDPAREAGILIPNYGAFMEGIRPLVGVEYFEGEDYVSNLQMDGSTLVQIAEGVGQFGGGQGLVAMTAMQVAVLMPALGRARESAQQLKGATQVRGLGQAIIVYMSNNDGERLPSYDELIEEGFITQDMLISPMGSAWDGQGDIVMRTTIEPSLVDSFRADVIVVMDRAMYINGTGMVNVGFADNHVESLSSWQVDEYLDMEINAGAREDFKLGE